MYCLNSESIQWNWKTTTTPVTLVIFSESIQWNWKTMQAHNPRCGRGQDKNPFNGIESSMSKVSRFSETVLDESIQWNWKKQGFGSDRAPELQESIQWNWKTPVSEPARLGCRRRIHSMELKASRPNSEPTAPRPNRIHSMELKDVLLSLKRLGLK